MNGGEMKQMWLAGAAEVDVTPDRQTFLFGYPHVNRLSTGVHDPLKASALFLASGDAAAGVLFLVADVIFVPRPVSERVRCRIAEATGVPVERIMVTATHTHSGPITCRMLSNADDPVVPDPDPAYLQKLEEGLADAGIRAVREARPATLGYATTQVPGIGTNRRDPNGPAISEIPVLVARDPARETPIGVLCVVSMHPTVLHEDWTEVSGDFPGLARQWLQNQRFGADCPVLCHMGASGNQSPRHVVSSNTIEEAKRLGEILGQAVASAAQTAKPIAPQQIGIGSRSCTLPVRSFPSSDEAQDRLTAARQRLDELRQAGAAKAAVRTAECDWFGAQETLTLARAAETGEVARAAETCNPAEVQVFRIGPALFIGWPGEVFVEHALAVRDRFPDAHIITLANGDLQGYLVTQEAVDEGAYEAGNAIMASPAGGDMLVAATCEVAEQLQRVEA